MSRETDCAQVGTSLDWIPLAALVATSVIAQIGQYGIGFATLPLWLMQHGSSAATTGLFASCEWAGMLAGIAFAPKAAGQIGFGRTVLVGLLLSLAGFGVLACSATLAMLLGASLIGFGMGLRWIAAETPLFRATPARWRGRVVGLHELLIACAAMLGPLLARVFSLAGFRPLIVGGLITAAALLPLLTVIRWPPMRTMVKRDSSEASRRMPPSVGMRVGIAVGVVAGLCNGALYGLLPQLAHARAMTPDMTSSLLISAGVGAAVAQYPMGWLADKLGLAYSAFALGWIALAASAALLGTHSLVALTIAVPIFSGAVRAMLTLATYAAAIDHASLADYNLRIIAGRFSVGSIVGPLCAAAAMSAAGADMLPAYFLVLCSGLTVYIFMVTTVFRRRRASYESLDYREFSDRSPN